MERKNLQKTFEKIGARITIRRGSSISPIWSRSRSPVRLNVTTDRQGEHFTLTVSPEINESEIVIQVLDYDSKLRQMLLFVKAPEMEGERLLVGRDEMHWFVAGISTAKTIKEAFNSLRPEAVTVAMQKMGVKNKDWKKRKTKGFVRQGEWFFVPVNFQEDKTTIIHKNEPINRSGGKPHYVEEIVRFGGQVIYQRGIDEIISRSAWEKLPQDKKIGFVQRVSGARVFGRGKVKHPDHHTINLVGWHEIHLSTEPGNTMTNAFID